MTRLTGRGVTHASTEHRPAPRGPVLSGTRPSTAHPKRRVFRPLRQGTLMVDPHAPEQRGAMGLAE
jgi:hypothetical protein